MELNPRQIGAPSLGSEEADDVQAENEGTMRKIEREWRSGRGGRMDVCEGRNTD